jgi:hypothetical protein
MGVTRTAAAAAARMGARAGERFRDLGQPTRNPFGRAELAAAWRRAYLAALRPRR